VSNYCLTNLNHNTLCANCRRVIQNHIYSVDDVYEIWWFNPNDLDIIPTGKTKLGHIIITVTGGAVNGHTIIAISGTHPDKAIKPVSLDNTIAAIILWLQSGYYVSVPIETFIDCVSVVT